MKNYFGAVEVGSIAIKHTVPVAIHILVTIFMSRLLVGGCAGHVTGCAGVADNALNRVQLPSRFRRRRGGLVLLCYRKMRTDG